MATQFHEQVSVVLKWFLVWNECEQMVVICSLLRRVSPVQARFVAQVFGQMFKNCADQVTEQLEQQANDPGFVSSLAKESKSSVMSHLLKCLPLIKVGNDKAKAEYLRIIPVVMMDSFKHRTDLEDCRHLLSYLIIHPAFSRDELPLLNTWQNSLSELHQTTTAAAPAVLPGGLPATPAQAASASMTAQDTTTGWSNMPDKDLASMALCGGQLGESQLLGISRSSAKRWTMASSSGDSGFSDVDKCSSVGSFPVGRPLRSSASMPLVEGSFTGFSRTSANAVIPPHATVPRREQLESAYGQEKCTAQSDEQQSKLLQPLPVGAGKNVPSNVAEWLNRHLQPTSGNKLHPNLNSDSLHSPLSPQSSVTSSGSGRSGDALVDERRLSQGDDIGGMRDISLWLKSLRLHKYAHLFQNMTYEEMLNLNDEWLEKHNVTKGAQKKIILSIQKLRSRQEALRQMEKDLLTPASMRETIGELMQMLKTPMKLCDSSVSFPSKVASSSEHECSGTTSKSSDDSSSSLETESIADGDLAGHMTRLFGKICSQLLVDPRFDGECLSGYLQLLDRSLSHQAFTKEQKKKMSSWKQQIYRTFQLHAIQKQNLDRHQTSLENVVLGQGAVPVERRALRGQQFLSNAGQPIWSFGLRPSCVLMPTSQPHDQPAPLSQSQCQNSSIADLLSASEGKQPLGRTKSAPIRSPQMGLSYSVTPGISQEGLTTDDIHASLDSLCISMTEHALEGGFGEVLWKFGILQTFLADF